MFFHGPKADRSRPRSIPVNAPAFANHFDGLSASRRSGALVGSRTTSMRRPPQVKGFFGRAAEMCDRRPTGGAISLQPFLLRKVFCSAIDTADRRPAGGAQCCHPEFSNHRFALLPSALFVELLPRCQLGVLDWKRVLPSRSRTECLCFRRRCS